MKNNLNGASFSSLLGVDDVICHTAEAEGKDAIKELLEKIAWNRNIGSTSDAYKAVMDREAIMSTLIAPGIAVPHARLASIDKVIVGISTSLEGIKFENPNIFDDEDNDIPDGIAHLVVVILAPKTQPGAYLQTVGSLAKMLNDKGIAKKIAEIREADDVWEFFDRDAMNLPNYVCAGDIMGRNFATLQEDDTLSKAIDMFVKHDVAELPVIDKNGELVGVVTESQLLRVCLPDYILWMDDLSPIANFQPFAELLHNEEHTWLADIMSPDLIMVNEDTPAIEVAKEMSRNDVKQVFVVREKRLVGLITIQDFINKVLRE